MPLAAKRLGREAFVAQQALLLRDPVVAQPDVQPALGHLEFRIGERHPVGAAIDHRRCLHRVLHQLQAHPDPGEAAEREAVEPEIEDLLHACGAEHRRMRIDQRPVGLVTGGGAFAGVVVAHRHQDAAMVRGAGHVHVAEHVARAVHARPLAIPKPEDAVELALATQFRLLAAPERGRGEVFVQTRLKHHVGGIEVLFRASSACRQRPAAIRDSR
jgi:hypothetical protein